MSEVVTTLIGIISYIVIPVLLVVLVVVCFQMATRKNRRGPRQ